MQSIIVFIDEDKGEIMPAGQKKKSNLAKHKFECMKKKSRRVEKLGGKQTCGTRLRMRSSAQHNMSGPICEIVTSAIQERKKRQIGASSEKWQILAPKTKKNND